MHAALSAISTFVKSLKATISFVTTCRLSVRLLGTTRRIIVIYGI